MILALALSLQVEAGFSRPSSRPFSQPFDGPAEAGPYRTLLWIRTAGSRVTAHERASWTNRAGAAMSQSGLSVYELKDGRIARVYYFPAERDAPAR